MKYMVLLQGTAWPTRELSRVNLWESLKQSLHRFAEDFFYFVIKTTANRETVIHCVD